MEFLINKAWQNIIFNVAEHVYTHMYVSFRQGSSLFWTHTLRPL